MNVFTHKFTSFKYVYSGLQTLVLVLVLVVVVVVVDVLLDVDVVATQVFELVFN